MVTGPAATGAQHTGADMSTVGNVFGMLRMIPGCIDICRKGAHSECAAVSIYV